MRSLISLLCIGLLCFCSSALAQTQNQPAGSQQATQAQQAEQAQQDQDIFTVPDGSPQELLEYVSKLLQYRPNTTDPEQLRETGQKVLKSLLEASEKILAQQADETTTNIAMRLKIQALVGLAESGDQEAEQKIEKWPEELRNANKPKLADKAQTLVYLWLLRKANKSEELKALVKKITDHLEKVEPGREEATLAYIAVNIAEGLGDQQLQLDLCERFAKVLQKSSDPAAARAGRMLAGTARRLGLVGNELQIEGKTVDGQPVDWKSYKGKVVLVVFWATWCGPCRRELPIIRENYDAYHSKGFDVLGISVDDDEQALRDFLQKEQLPWTVIFDKSNGENTMSDRYGVFAIPETILVGKDGKVVAIGIRDEQIRKHLEELLGPPENEKQEKAQPTG